jgi:CHAD domain-containing protein
MADGKWITDLRGTTPLVDAARRVLAVRLEVVHEVLPLALHHWKEDPEHIHQLRVGTRRAGAALAIFGLCLPAKVAKRVGKHLRRLRRAAGAARDWDVLGCSLMEREKSATAGQRQGLDFLVGYFHGQRVAAHSALQAVGANAPFDFERLVAETLGAVQKPVCDPPLHVLGDLARPWLGDILRTLHVAASGKLDQYEHLHQVRILGKHLRYGMEVFAAGFDPAFKECHYPQIEEMQEILGQANDSHVAVQRLAELRELLRLSRPAQWKRFQQGIDAVLRYHQRRLPVQRRTFLKWWSRWVKSGTESGLVGMIHTPA